MAGVLIWFCIDCTLISYSHKKLWFTHSNWIKKCSHLQIEAWRVCFVGQFLCSMFYKVSSYCWSRVFYLSSEFLVPKGVWVLLKLLLLIHADSEVQENLGGKLKLHVNLLQNECKDHASRSFLWELYWTRRYGVCPGVEILCCESGEFKSILLVWDVNFQNKYEKSMIPSCVGIEKKFFFRDHMI